MFYHHVLGWKACYTSFAAVLFKPTSRTPLEVSISSSSGEGGGEHSSLGAGRIRQKAFPLVLLQAKAGGATFLNHDTARLSDPQIDAPL